MFNFKNFTKYAGLKFKINGHICSNDLIRVPKGSEYGIVIWDTDEGLLREINTWLSHIDRTKEQLKHLKSGGGIHPGLNIKGVRVKVGTDEEGWPVWKKDENGEFVEILEGGRRKDYIKDFTEGLNQYRKNYVAAELKLGMCETERPRNLYVTALNEKKALKKVKRFNKNLTGAMAVLLTEVEGV